MQQHKKKESDTMSPMDKEARCGNCIWFQQKGKFPVSQEIYDSVTPHFVQRPAYGECDASGVITNRRTTSVTLCEAVDPNGDIVFLPRMIKKAK